MKKVVVVMFLLGLASVSFAQAWPHWNQINARVDAKLAAKNAEQAVVEAVQAQQAVNAQDKQAIEASAAEASKILESLVAGYPGNDALKKVAEAHKDLIGRGAQTGAEEFVAQNMFLGQESLLHAVKSVTVENKQLGKIVAAVVHHRYYVEIKGEGYTLQQISAWAHEVFPNLPYSEDELK